MVFWGFPYLLNTATREVHYLPAKTEQCGISRMKRKNKQYLCRNSFDRLVIDLYGSDLEINGCRHCLSKHDTD